MSNEKKLFERRRRRVRTHIRKVASDRPRLSVHRSNLHISVQVIDDASGKTVAAASSMEKEVRSQVKSGANVAAATVVGQLIAKRAKAAGIEKVVFDRGGYLFHGRVKALADSAREGGLNF